MLRSGLQTLENVAIALKNPHGERVLRAFRGKVVRGSGCGSGMVPSRIVRNQSTFKNMSAARNKKREKRKNGLATQTGWQRELLPGLVPNLWSRISKGDVTRIGMSRHKPRQIPQDSAASPKVGTFDPTLSRAHSLLIR